MNINQSLRSKNKTENIWDEIFQKWALNDYFLYFSIKFIDYAKKYFKILVKYTKNEN
jgi:hypothetical protein